MTSTGSDGLPGRPARQTTRLRPSRLALVASGAGRGASVGAQRLTVLFGGRARARVIVLLSCVLALASADTATVGASATELVHSLHIDNADIGLLVAIGSVVGAVASVPFGMLADRVRRTRTLSFSVALWGVAMLLSATARTFGGLLVWRLWLGLVTAAAGPAVASLVGDYFASAERGKIYSYILTGELVGAGAGFAITGDIAALSWRAAFVILALAAFPLAWALLRLPEPRRGGAGVLVAETSPDTGPTGSDGPAASDVSSGSDGSAGSDMSVGSVGSGDAFGGPHEAAADQAPDARDPGRQVTDAQHLAAGRGIAADEGLVQRAAGRRMGVVSATRYVLAVKTNVALIISSACGYYFLAGVETFGVEFVRGHYHVNAALANLLMIVIGGGAAVGVIVAGPASDRWLHRGRLNARVLVAALAATATVLLFLPALLSHSLVTALPYVIFAAAALSAQNPPIDAARLDIMPAKLWGRAEGIRTFLRTMAQALAPVMFGLVSDYIGLQATFLVMLLPLSASAFFLFRAMRTYPRDVATAAAVSARAAPGTAGTGGT